MMQGVLAATLMVVVTSGCAPSAMVEPTALFNAVWNGPIEAIALVMAPPSGSIRPLAESTFNLSSLEFMRHPYARQRFDVVERSAMDRVLEEVGLGQSGLVDSATAPRIGRLLGARYVVIVDLINISVRPARVGGLDLGGYLVGVGWADLDVTLAMRLVDVETGRVRANGSGRVQSSVFTGVSIEGFDFGSAANREIVLDLVPEAARRALNDLFRQIV